MPAVKSTSAWLNQQRSSLIKSHGPRTRDVARVRGPQREVKFLVRRLPVPNRRRTSRLRKPPSGFSPTFYRHDAPHVSQHPTSHPRSTSSYQDDDIDHQQPPSRPCRQSPSIDPEHADGLKSNWETHRRDASVHPGAAANKRMMNEQDLDNMDLDTATREGRSSPSQASISPDARIQGDAAETPTNGAYCPRFSLSRSQSRAAADPSPDNWRHQLSSTGHDDVAADPWPVNRAAVRHLLPATTSPYTVRTSQATPSPDNIPAAANHTNSGRLDREYALTFARRPSSSCARTPTTPAIPRWKPSQSRARCNPNPHPHPHARRSDQAPSSTGGSPPCVCRRLLVREGHLAAQPSAPSSTRRRPVHLPAQLDLRNVANTPSLRPHRRRPIDIPTLLLSNTATDHNDLPTSLQNLHNKYKGSSTDGTFLPLDAGRPHHHQIAGDLTRSKTQNPELTPPILPLLVPVVRALIVRISASERWSRGSRVRALIARISASERWSCADHTL
nr:unnamed protein product [Digitaria exilis]